MRRIEKRQAAYDRRSFLKVGVELTVGSLAVRVPWGNTAETLTYPSKEDIYPQEWSVFGECRYTSVSEPGPYFIDKTQIRRDIREKQKGENILLRFEVIDSIRCEPLPKALVEIWHCNAGGWYSGYSQISPDKLPPAEGIAVNPQESERFHRGVQVCDEQGRCEFITKYPGWYAGRTVHIHAKVHLNNSRLITTQLFFPQKLSDKIHQTGSYKPRGISPYRNENDVILAMSAGAPGSWPIITKEGDTYVGTLRVGVINAA